MPAGGYRWWYLDALSDDGCYGCTVIAFIGSVFSPYYARSPAGDPEDHVAFNIALYGLSGPAWTMTERGSTHLARTRDVLTIGPSQMRWDNDALTISLDEVTVPLPRRLRGTITINPGPIFHSEYNLDDDGQHRWCPLAPCARVAVALERPAWRWSGHGYLDTNHGDASLASGFKHWNWSRAKLADGGTVVIYDAIRQDTSRQVLGLRFSSTGDAEHIMVTPSRDLPAGAWRMAGTIPGTSPRLQRRLENTPFYTRSLVKTQLLDQTVTAIHESLSLDRLTKTWVQMLLPFRMPRRR